MLDLREYAGYFERRLKAEKVPGLHLEKSVQKQIRWSFNGPENEKYQCRINYSRKHNVIRVERRSSIKRIHWIKEDVITKIDENFSIDEKHAEELIAKLIKKIKTALLS